jgi:lysozyme family protein
MARTGGISWAQYRQGVSWLNVAVDRASITKRLSKNREWNGLTPQQQDEKIMAEMGVTQEERNEALERLKERITDPDYSITKADIDAEYSNGHITKAERENMKEIIGGYSKETRKIASLQQSRLKMDLNAIFSEKLFYDSAERKGYKELAIDEFRDNLYYLDPRSKTYGDDVKRVRIEAVSKAIEAHSKSVDSLLSDKDDYETVVGRVLDSAWKEPAVNYTPRFRVDPISLSDDMASPSGDFEASVAHVFVSEGGYTTDDGGTNMGIRQSTLNAAVKSGIVTETDVKKLTKEDATKIYDEMYWKKARADELPSGVGYLVFDMAVNHGVSGAVSMLQDVLGLKATGEIDDATIEATWETEPNELIDLLKEARQKRYDSIVEKNPSKKKYSDGWTGRNKRVTETSKDMAGASNASLRDMLLEEDL